MCVFSFKILYRNLVYEDQTTAIMLDQKSSSWPTASSLSVRHRNFWPMSSFYSLPSSNLSWKLLGSVVHLAMYPWLGAPGFLSFGVSWIVIFSPRLKTTTISWRRKTQGWLIRKDNGGHEKSGDFLNYAIHRHAPGDPSLVPHCENSLSHGGHYRCCGRWCPGERLVAWTHTRGNSFPFLRRKVK